MLRIDTHNHTSLVWFEPVDVVLFHMQRNKVDKCVLVQIKSEYDNSYLIDCAKRHPGIFSVVGHVDMNRPDASEVLADWTAKGMNGVRIWGADRSPGKDPLEIWRKANDLGLVVSCGGSGPNFATDDFRRLVQELPDLPFVIEHMGLLGGSALAEKKSIPDEFMEIWKKVLALSKFPNVYMKIAGFGEYMQRPSPIQHPTWNLRTAPPLLDMAIEAFGANHLMVAPDPTSSTREGYGNVWNYLQEYLSKRSTAEQEAIFGKTALGLFTFGPKKGR